MKKNLLILTPVLCSDVNQSGLRRSEIEVFIVQAIDDSNETAEIGQHFQTEDSRQPLTQQFCFLW